MFPEGLRSGPPVRAKEGLEGGSTQVFDEVWWAPLMKGVISKPENKILQKHQNSTFEQESAGWG